METIKRLVPLFNRVLVKRAEPKTQTKGGIQLPGTPPHQVLHGTVVAVGPGTLSKNGDYVPCCIKVGDYVLLPECGGTKITADDSNSYQLYRESEILAKVNLP